MPPQQADCLLDFLDGFCDFGAHVDACLEGERQGVNPRSGNAVRRGTLTRWAPPALLGCIASA
jgi:hypothetical protein